MIIVIAFQINPSQQPLDIFQDSPATNTETRPPCSRSVPPVRSDSGSLFRRTLKMRGSVAENKHRPAQLFGLRCGPEQTPKLQSATTQHVARHPQGTTYEWLHSEVW